MAFDPAALKPWFTDWPDRPEALWRYETPAGDTIEDVLASGYFDAAEPRLCAGSVIFVARSDPDGDGLAETVLLTVLSRKPAGKPGNKKRSRVAAMASGGQAAGVAPGLAATQEPAPLTSD